MSRTLTVLTLTSLLATIGFLGLLPTTAAQETCVPVLKGEFEFGACADATSEQCAVWTYSRFDERCYVAGGGPVAGEVCVPILRGEFEYGICANGEDCLLWDYSRFNERCYAA